MSQALARPSLPPEPLTRLDDAAEYEAGLAQYRSGAWSEDQWTGFRVRFGIYGHKDPTQQMVRLKVPGGLAPLGWLRTVAEAIRRYAPDGVHITTRQNFQLYGVKLADTPALLRLLYSNGLSSREAGGNTLRNATACPLAGSCPKERVDAGVVAQQVATAWIRHPLGQHMPRKVKLAVSGCEADCAEAGFHDIAFVATERAGENGFRVVAAGGLGARPMAAQTVLDFISESEVPAALEALMRVHHAHSNRQNKNTARLKFAAHKQGEDSFRAHVEAEFATARTLPQRAWNPLSWRQPESHGPATNPTAPVGIVAGHDGHHAVIAAPPLGWMDADTVETVATLAEEAGLKAVRLLPTQAFLFSGLSPQAAATLAERLTARGVIVQDGRRPVRDVVSCPGTSTCPVGITNSNALAQALLQEDGLSGVKLRLSGCQNSCGQHHLADFGLHGLSKKINGQPAPHYRFHLGGTPTAPGQIGMEGPLVPARLAIPALTTLVAAWRSGRGETETVRAWAERVGPDGLNALVAGLAVDPTDPALFIDHGDQETFTGPLTGKADCAAPVVSPLFLEDLALDGLLTHDRALQVGNAPAAREALERGATSAARRLLHHFGLPLQGKGESAAEVRTRLRLALADAPSLSAALDRLEQEWSRPALAHWLAVVTEELSSPALLEAAQ